MNVTVIGLGKIGLPLAIAVAEAGHQVTGVDASAYRRQQILDGTADDRESELRRRMGRALRKGWLGVAKGLDSVSASDVVMVVVPVGLDGSNKVDLGPITHLTRELAARISQRTLIIFESTLPVGTTRNVLAPILAADSNYSLGRELWVAYSPERVFSGRVFADLGRYPKIVGGADPASTEKAKAFYESFLVFEDRADLSHPNGVWDLGSADAAEFTKLAETTYRDVNIALANEFAQFADRAGLDVAAVISAANSQPFSHIHEPGASVGGHCIPVYPHMYLQGHPDASLPRTARHVNEEMPTYIIQQVEELLGDLTNRRIGILGVTYRRAVKETSNSGAITLAHRLQGRGATVFCHDPLLSNSELTELGLQPLEVPSSVDALILHTDHEGYADYSQREFPGVRVVIDGRDSLSRANWRNTHFKVIGRPMVRSDLPWGTCE